MRFGERGVLHPFFTVIETNQSSLLFFFSPMASVIIPDNLTSDQYVYLAKLVEQVERYEKMVQFMEKLVVGSTPASELTVEERNLLSVAYKNVIGSLRAVWRIVSSIEQKEKGRKNEEHVALVKEYRSKVEAKLSEVCASILKILDSNLVPSASSSESKVFYLKMKGDYHRYSCFDQSVGPYFFTLSSGPGLSSQTAPGLDSLDDKSKQGGIYGGSTLFGGASATNASTSSNLFGISATASTPTFTSQSVGSALSCGGLDLQVARVDITSQGS